MQKQLETHVGVLQLFFYTRFKAEALVKYNATETLKCELEIRYGAGRVKVW